MSAVLFSVRRRDLAWAVALIVLLSAVWVAKSDIADAGGSPPGEGIAVVYVAVGTGFPDALGVGPGAGADAAPIIILPKDPPIPGLSSAELVRLDPRTLIIVGGTGVISDAMEDALVALLPNAAISRIAGGNRYDTNAAFSAATFPIEGWASVPAAAFTAPDPATDVVQVGQTAFNGTDGQLVAPIQLPHGAEILELKVHAFDSSEAVDLTVYLYRVDNGATASTVAYLLTENDPGPTTATSTAIDPGTGIVNNEDYSYLIGAFDADGNPSPYIINVMVRYRLGSSTG